VLFDQTETSVRSGDVDFEALLLSDVRSLDEGKSTATLTAVDVRDENPAHFSLIGFLLGAVFKITGNLRLWKLDCR
jgi:hypothetical protein